MTRQRSKTRVNISNENALVLEALGEPAGLASVFKNQAKALVFAASVGYHFNQYEQAASQTTKAIHFEQIDGATDLGGDLDAVFALARARDIAVLAPQGSDDDAAERPAQEDSGSWRGTSMEGCRTFVNRTSIQTGRSRPCSRSFARWTRKPRVSSAVLDAHHPVAPQRDTASI